VRLVVVKRDNFREFSTHHQRGGSTDLQPTLTLLVNHAGEFIADRNNQSWLVTSPGL